MRALKGLKVVYECLKEKNMISSQAKVIVKVVVNLEEIENG